MKYRVNHTTHYTYSEPASLSHNELVLQPRTTPWQEIIDCRIAIEPYTQHKHQRRDFFGNPVDFFIVQQPHGELEISAISTIVTSAPSVPDPELTPPWEEVAAALARYETPFDLDGLQFACASPLTTTATPIREYALGSFTVGCPVLAGAIDLIDRIYTEFSYDKDATSVDTPVMEVLQKKKGVCQDFAHFAISCLRSLGLSARYVSGYLETLPPPGKPKLIGADASHAWFSLYIPGYGWVDLDPTNNLLPQEQHITVAWGRDYSDVTPVKGVVMGGGSHRLNVTVDVKKIP